MSATPYFAKKTLITYWNTEKEDGKPWFPNKRYLGIEAALAGIAVKAEFTMAVFMKEILLKANRGITSGSRADAKYHC